MMSGFKKFAVAGAGNIGLYFIEELLRYKQACSIDSVSVLTRPSSTAAVPSGAQHHRVDYNSPASLAEALAGVDVLIATFGHDSLATQYPLAQAAKDAGVKLFVPSEFGNPTKGKQGTAGRIGEKGALHLFFEKIGLPYTVFYTGAWTDFVLTPLFHWDLTNGKVFIGASGDTPITFTACIDIARFVAHVLVHLPIGKLANRVFRLEGERVSFNEIVRHYEAKTGKTLEISRRSREELQADIKANPSNIVPYVLLAWDNGDGIVGDGEDSGTVVWPEWSPKKVLEVVG